MYTVQPVIALLLLTTVDDRPEVVFLYRHVRKQLCASGAEMWKNLGVELLGDTNALEIIKLSNSNDVQSCCSAMFRLWLERGTTASWRQLINALKQLQLNYLANQIESKLIIPGSEASGVNPGNHTSA